MSKICSVKKLILTMIFALAVIAIGNGFVIKAEAADAVVRFGSGWYEKNQNDLFPMGIYVQNLVPDTATDSERYNGVGSYHLEISYDTTRLQYSSGATSIADAGVITLDGVGNNNGTANKTMIYFNALYGGETYVTVTAAEVYSVDGTLMNVTSLGTVKVTVAGAEPENNDGDNQNPETTQKEEPDADSEVIEDDGDLPDDDNADSNISEDDGIGEDLTAEQDIDSDTTAEVDGSTSETATESGTATSDIADGTEVTALDSVNSSGDVETKKDNKLVRYLIIGIAGVVCVVILIVVIRTVARVSERRKKLNRMMQTENDNQEWAFEFDTIDDDNGKLDDWSYDSAIIEDAGTVEFDAVKEAENLAAFESALMEPQCALSDEEDFLFEFDSVTDDKK